jgi:hypothetical protein
MKAPCLNFFEMKQFIVTIKHERGTTKLRVPAVNEDAAKYMATISVPCKESEIVRVREAMYKKRKLFE